MVTRKQWGLGLAMAAAGFAGLAAPGTAHAQTGWALDHFEPTPSGDVFFMAEHPWYSSTRVFSAGLVMDYASNPLVQTTTFTSGANTAGGPVTTTTTNSVVSGMLVGHLGVAASFADRVGVSLSLPISLTQSGTASSLNGSSLAPAGSLAPGDLRLGVRIRVAGHADRDPISFHIAGSVWFPLGSASNNMGDGNFRIEPRLLIAGRASVLRWSLGGGFMIRSSESQANLGIDNEVRITAALGLALLDGALTIGPEAYVVSAVGSVPNPANSAAFSTGEWGSEIIGSVHYNIARTVLVGVGAGGGLQLGYGIPGFRGLASVAYAPEPPPPPVGPIDTDHDGVMDPDDLCPTVPMGAHPDPARRGCPEGDRDGDGVFDSADQCPDTPQGDHPDPARVGCPLGDRDHDGVLDDTDQCPDTPQGDHPDPTRVGCPDGDRDHDGVFDSADQCPDTPAGPHPDPARPGCPLADRDGDTVPDATDHCPDVPGAPSEDPNQNGCPSSVRMEAGRITLLQPVFFQTNRDEVKRQSFPVLERVADVLRSSAYIRRVSVDGHTDSRGDPAYNLALSQRRMESVVRWLAAHGVDASRLEPHGFGDTRPVATNETRDGRARNRRVEFVIIDPAPTSGPAVSTPVEVHNAPAAPAAPAAGEHHGHHHHGH